MKKLSTLIVTILLSITALSVSAQNTIVEKQKFIVKKDNMDLGIYYPLFTSGKYSDSLNQAVYDMFTRIHHKIDRPIIKTDEQLRDFFLTNGKLLWEAGKKRSIDAFNYTHISLWHFFENKYVATLIIDQYIDMGTAHPDIICQDLNIDLSTGRDFDPFEVVKDTSKLMDIAARIFCKERNLPQNALRLQTGLRYELADLPMANICGFTQDGFILFYNRGEIANHSMPAIQIKIPYSEFKHLLPADFFEGTIQVQEGEAQAKAFMKKISKGDDRYIRKKQNRGGYRTY